MSGLLWALIIFLICAASGVSSHGEDFFRECPPRYCSAGGPEIRFPFRLKFSPPSCGLEGFELQCSGNDTTLDFPWSAGYHVTMINYSSWQITLDGPSSWVCPANITFPDYPTVYEKENAYTVWKYTVVNCSINNTGEFYDVIGPVHCMSGVGYFVYVVGGYQSMSDLPSYCDTITSGSFPIPPDYYDGFRQRGKSFYYQINCIKCYDCESTGKGWLGFSNKAKNEIKCFKGSHVMLIAGASAAGVVAVILVVFAYLYIFRKPEKEKETRLKVEKFLASYNSTQLTRYTYKDIKKIANRFKHKLGQGGFGNVYKGELPNGIPVAVKMLEMAVGNGNDFMNEVATIGRIHHANVVHLLGFFSEGSRRALVYEFMPNESLEKFIFSKEPRNGGHPLSLEKLQEIAVGVARGVEYLHQGCNQRILHFDIKPHNILLDHDFNPKISDFGLAKLCSRDESIVSMTAARGTMGYIAPEIYSRNFGTVSYKSDVYSFGMLLLEMVGGRKNIDPTIENLSQIYFPEWIYDRLVNEEQIVLELEIKGKEEIAKKLAIVALWCIQWAPADRPTMTEVVHMLTGNLETLQIPPKPFISSFV